MHRPSMNDILKGSESYYSLVLAVAKRARNIAVEAEEKDEILIEKPVQLAVEEFACGKCKLIESEQVTNDGIKM